MASSVLYLVGSITREPKMLDSHVERVADWIAVNLMGARARKRSIRNTYSKWDRMDRKTAKLKKADERYQADARLYAARRQRDLKLQQEGIASGRAAIENAEAWLPHKNKER